MIYSWTIITGRPTHVYIHFMIESNKWMSGVNGLFQNINLGIQLELRWNVNVINHNLHTWHVSRSWYQSSFLDLLTCSHIKELDSLRGDHRHQLSKGYVCPWAHGLTVLFL